jgi:hypothetical protein
MTFESIKRKIKNPPAAQNLVRLIEIDDEAKTTRNIANFALSIPSFNYIPGTKMCVEKVRMNLDLATALIAVSNVGAPAGRAHNADFVRAFYEYDIARRYSSLKSVENYQGMYRISRDINVPTTPTFTVIDEGKQIPVVVCGWKDLPLDRSKLKMWMTMLESGLFSFGDYRHSPAEIRIFPEVEMSDGSWVRKPYILNRGDIECFTELQMRDIVAMYARAQAAAMPMAEAKWNERNELRKQKERDSGIQFPSGDNPDTGLPDLFGKK